MKLKRKKDKRTPEQRVEDVRLRKEYHWLVCKQCGGNGEEYDKTIKAFICWRCTDKMCPVPDLPPTAVKKYAEYEESFDRGWWKKILFSGEHDGETLYFNRGRKISKAEYDRLADTGNG